jgi:hypothetical protein
LLARISEWLTASVNVGAMSVQYLFTENNKIRDI